MHPQSNNQPTKQTNKRTYTSRTHTHTHTQTQTSTSQKLIFVIIASSFSSCHFSRNKEQCYIPLSRIRIIDLTSVDK